MAPVAVSSTDLAVFHITMSFPQRWNYAQCQSLGKSVQYQVDGGVWMDHDGRKSNDGFLVLVLDQISEGKTKEEIYDFLISKYGEWIVYKPTLNKNNFSFVVNGTEKARIGINGFTGTAADTFRLRNAGATATVANIHPRRDDADTGLGSNAVDQLSLIQGGVEGLRLSEVSSHVIQKVEQHVGITASTTQSQGNGILLSSYNQVATVANANDTVTLTAAEAGVKQTIVNNGANTLQIFPASGDDLGSGVDTATTLAAGNSITFLAYDVTNWNII